MYGSGFAPLTFILDGDGWHIGLQPTITSFEFWFCYHVSPPSFSHYILYHIVALCPKPFDRVGDIIASFCGNLT